MNKQSFTERVGYSKLELGDLGPFCRSENSSIMENLYLSIDQLSPLHGKKKLEKLFFRWNDYLFKVKEDNIYHKK